MAAFPWCNPAGKQRFNAWQNLHYRLGRIEPRRNPSSGALHALCRAINGLGRREALNENEPLTVEWKDGRIRR